jgi:tetratricopeptide (TPR) repeat protein
MNPTLNLFEHLLARGHQLQELGRHRDAGRLLARLAGFRDLPGDVAEQVQVRLAELALRRRRYARARRHLTAALRHRPDSARYHYLLAGALQAEGADLERAAEHYRRALELAPEHARYLADAGLLALRLNRTEQGLALLRQAAERAPDSAEAAGKLVKGLRLAGRADEARSALRAALFRNPRSARLRALWIDLQLQELRRRQENEQLDRQEADEPVLLPFVRRERSSTEQTARPVILRRDDKLGPPSGLLPARPGRRVQ